MKIFKERKIILKTIILIIGLAPILLPVAVSASNEYTVLAPLPGTTDCGQQVDKTGGCKTTLEKYLPGVFKLAIGLAAVAAVLMIVIGGFQYISTDAIKGKSDGKERIKNAIFSLVLIIGAWLILHTINPKLLELNLNIEEIKLNIEEIKLKKRMTEQQINESNLTRKALKENQGVETYAGPCTEGQTTGCVNLNGLKSETMIGLASLKLELGCSSCNIVITGGTEDGHSATGGHPEGKAVDIRPDPELNKKLNYPSPKEGDKKTLVFEKTGKRIDVTFTYETAGGNDAGTSSGPHWHVTFK